MAHVHAALALVVDKHGEAAAVLRAFLGAGQDEVDVRVAVGDESLHAVQAPAVFFLVVGSFEHHTLQIAAGIRLGEVHRHGFALADARDVLLALLFAAELIERVDARLEGPDVLETGIGGGDDFRKHGERGVGQVETAVASRHAHAPQAGLARGVEVFIGLRSINHALVLQVGTFEVHVL